MKPIDILQRLQRNDREALIIYARSGDMEPRAWLIDSQGVLTHRAGVDRSAARLMRSRSLQWVSSQLHSRARIYRPVYNL